MYSILSKEGEGKNLKKLWIKIFAGSFSLLLARQTTNSIGISQSYRSRRDREPPPLASTHQMSNAESRTDLLLYSICGRQTFIQYPCLMRVRAVEPLSRATKRARISYGNLHFLSCMIFYRRFTQNGHVQPFHFLNCNRYIIEGVFLDTNTNKQHVLVLPFFNLLCIC